MGFRDSYVSLRGCPDGSLAASFRVADDTITASVSELTLDEWIGEFLRLKKLNTEIIKADKAKRGAGK